MTVDTIHREHDRPLWEHCGISRNRAGLEQVLAWLPEIREVLWNQICVPGTGNELNPSATLAA